MHNHLVPGILTPHQMVLFLQQLCSPQDCVIYNHDNIEFVTMKRQHVVDYIGGVNDIQQYQGVIIINEIYSLHPDVYGQLYLP